MGFQAVWFSGVDRRLEAGWKGGLLLGHNKK